MKWLEDKSDPRVKAALERTCGICHVPAGVECRLPFETDQELGRIVHLARVNVE